MLRPQDDDHGIYLAACGLFSGWRGCEIWRSNDGVTYTRAGLTMTAPTPQGYATTVLQAFTGGHVIDTLSHVTIALAPGSGALASVTEQQFLDGLQGGVIGDELVLFRDAELLSADTYRITRFLRYRAGTEGAVHATGEPFVLLSPATIRRLALSAGDKGSARWFKAVTAGRTLASTVPQKLLFQSIGKKPLKPIDVRAGKDAANNWVARWIRRSRLAAGWNDFVDTPDDGTVFDLEIWNSTFTTLKRTIAAIAGETYTYSAADQTTDFGGTQSTLYWRLHPASAEYGRGDYVQRTST